MSDSLKSGSLALNPSAICDAGIDWITVFQAGHRSTESLRDVAQGILSDNVSMGNDLSTFRSHGFNGYRSGGISYGTRYDGYMATLTGSDARERWLDLMPHADNVSRLDVQTTLQFDERQRDIIKRAYAHCRRMKFKRGRRPEFIIRDSTRTGSTMYFGAEKSDVRGRFYDKGTESKTAPPEQMLRLELQFRRDPAKLHAESLCAGTYEPARAVGLVCREFNKRGLEAGHSKTEVLELSRGCDSTDDARRLAYLRTVGAAMVTKVLRTYSKREVLEALGFEDCHCED